MKKISWSLLLLLLVPLVARADLAFVDNSDQIQFAPISVNPSLPIVNNEARVTVTVFNNSDKEQQATVDIFAGKGGDQIGNDLPVTMSPKGVDSVTVSWKPTVGGVYYMNAQINPITADDDASNNYYQMAVEVDQDTDHDGTSNKDDTDDDNDGVPDRDDPAPTNASVPGKDGKDGEDGADGSDGDDDTGVGNENGSNSDFVNGQIITMISPLVGEQVEFTVDEMLLGEGTTVLWKFSDGQSFTGPNPQRSFDAPGIYSVTRTIVNSAGDLKSDSFNFRVSESEGFFLGGTCLWILILLLLLLLLLASLLYKCYHDKKTDSTPRNW